MNFRLSQLKDIQNILAIIEEAKIFLKEQGVNQWQNGYPNEEVIVEDIKNSCSYVLEEDGKVVGTTVIGFCGETTYENIYGGVWLSNDSFAVIHRMAISKSHMNRGFSTELMKNVEKLVLAKGIKSIKVDTHKDNKVMQKFLQKNGYKYCGIIYLEDGNERLAFEKLI